MRQILSACMLLLLLCGCRGDAPEALRPLGEPDSQEAPVVTGSGSCRPCAEEETAVSLPDAESILFARWDGEALLGVWLFGDELRTFRDALPELRGHQQEGWSPPADPWPVYALSVSGAEADYEAACCDGLWLDSLGNTLIAGPDPAPLWERFGGAAEAANVLPARRELALAGGDWDARFLVPAVHQEPSPQTPMTLTAEGGNLSWALQNRTGQALTCGNGGGAQLDVLLGKTWYAVPFLSGSHCAYTMEAYAVPPGEDFSGALWREPYGAVPPGTYRLRFPWRADSSSGIAAAPFRFQGGVFVPL